MSSKEKIFFKNKTLKMAGEIYFSQTAYDKANEPKELYRIEGAEYETLMRCVAEHVWGINNGSDKEKIDKAIATESFFQSLGVGTHLADYNISDETIAQVSERFSNRKMLLGERENITPSKVEEILTNAK